MSLDWIDQERDEKSSESAVRQACYASELDFLPEDVTDAQIIDLVSQQITGRICAYKTARGARAYLVSRLDLLRLIADAEPEIFDSIILAYAEHQTAFP